MLTKSITSLAVCALALTAARSAGAAVSVGATETSATVVVTAPPASAPAATTVPSKAKGRHRVRKATPARSKIAKVAEHHAEPARTPQVAAVVAAPMNLTKATEKKDAPVTSVGPANGEIMVGAAHVDTKAVLAPSAEAPSRSETAPAEIEVKTPGSRSTIRRGARLEVKVVPAPGAALRAKAAVAKPPCLHEGVEFVHGQEVDSFPLTKCDGAIAPLALEKLSVLARPESAPHPRSVEELARAKGPEIATGIRRVDPGLIQRVQAIVDHFSKAGPVKVSVVSGYRPLSSGSYHATAQALDMHLEGIRNEAVVEYCKTLSDTGCGYYPNSSFVHVDVRQPGTGHVAWIDASGPGEAPRYVSSWPPPPDPDVKVASQTENVVEKLDPELPPLPADAHPTAPREAAAVLSVPFDTAK